jgi:hypothetical protein
MALYDRDVPSQDRATEQIWKQLQSYSLLRRTEGITVADLMRDHEISDADTVFAAIGLLEKEKNVRLEKSTGHADHRDGTRIFPLP